MLFELVATISAGFAAGGFALIARHLTGGWLSRAIVPVAAGGAMLGFAIWSEYTWASRTMAGLPDGLTEVRRAETSTPLKPWTLIAPQTSGLIAADAEGARRHPDHPDLRLTDLYVFGRWRPASRVPQLVDCQAPARADVAAGDLTRPPSELAWIDLSEDDPIVTSVCS